jgi:hypothetical protein
LVQFLLNPLQTLLLFVMQRCVHKLDANVVELFGGSSLLLSKLLEHGLNVLSLRFQLLVALV